MYTMTSKVAAAALMASAGVLTLGSIAEAADFSLSSYNITANNSDPGLVVQTAELLAEPFNFSLEVGDSPITVDLFKIWTKETTVNSGEDTVPKDIAVDFNFSLPEFFGGTVAGDTSGNRILGGLFQNGEVVWDAPGEFLFGNGGILKVDLSNETFNTGAFGLKEGFKHGSKVQATFTLVADSVDVPEPATMLGLGLVGAALLAQKRTRKETV